MNLHSCVKSHVTTRSRVELRSLDAWRLDTRCPLPVPIAFQLNQRPSADGWKVSEPALPTLPASLGWQWCWPVRAVLSLSYYALLSGMAISVSALLLDCKLFWPSSWSWLMSGQFGAGLEQMCGCLGRGECVCPSTGRHWEAACPHLLLHSEEQGLF